MQADLGFHAAASHEATLKLAAGSPVWVYNFDYWSTNVFPSDYPFEKGNGFDKSEHWTHYMTKL